MRAGQPMSLQEPRHPQGMTLARGSRAATVLYVHTVGFIALLRSLPRSACSVSRRTCCERCFMYNSFLGICLFLQNRARKTCRVLLAPLHSAGREAMAPCLCFISTHWGDGDGGSSRVKQDALKSID